MAKVININRTEREGTEKGDTQNVDMEYSVVCPACGCEAWGVFVDSEEPQDLKEISTIRCAVCRHEVLRDDERE